MMILYVFSSAFEAVKKVPHKVPAAKTPQNL